MGEMRINKAAYDAVANTASTRQTPGTAPAVPAQQPAPTPAPAGDRSQVRQAPGGHSMPMISLLDDDQIESRAQNLIEAHYKPVLIFGRNLDEAGLGVHLARELRDSAKAAVVARVLDKVADNEVICALLGKLSDDKLKTLAGSDDGKALLTQMYRSLNSVFRTAEECRGQLRIMGAMSPLYGPLATFEFNPPQAFTDALRAKGVKLQKLSEASNLSNTRYDNYEATVRLDKPEQALDLFKKFAANFNAVGDKWFSTMEVFTLRGGDGKTVLPKVGDIYDINILGPDNGAVMVGSAEFTEQAGHVTIVTITEPPGTGYGVHPENGTREFGFRNNADGTTTFYTSGASRGLNSMIHLAGAYPQMWSAQGLINGFVEQAVKDYGAEVTKPLTSEMKDPILGK